MVYTDDMDNPADLQDLSQAVFNQRLYNAAFAMSAILSNVISIWVAVRRQPPLDRELAEFRKREDCIATHLREKEDHRKEHEREEAREAKAHDNIDQRLEKGEELFRHVENSLGSVDANIEILKEYVIGKKPQGG